MSVVSDFIGHVADPYRTTSPNAQQVHGGSFQSSNPATAAWLEANPAISAALAAVSDAIVVLEGRADGARTAFDAARERFNDAKEAEATLHYNAGELGKAADPEMSKRLMRARETAKATSERAAELAYTASQEFAHTRNALNAAVHYVGDLAVINAQVVLAQPVKLPKGSMTDIIISQRRTLSDLATEEANARAAWPPLEDALAIAKAKVDALAARGGVRVSISASGVDLHLPIERLNVQPLLGDAPVETVNVEALNAFLFHDTLLAAYEARIRDKYADVELTLDGRARKAALKDIVERRLAAERIEVAAIKAEWALGNYAPLRTNVSPVVLLGVDSVTNGAPKEPAGFIGKAYLGETLR